MKRWLATILTVGIVVAMIIAFINQPSKGSINYKPVDNQGPTPTPEEFIRYDAKDLSFAYANKYDLRELPMVGSQVGNWELVGKPGITEHVVVSEATVDGNDLANVSGVTLRRVKSTEYTESKVEIMKTDGVAFELKNTDNGAVFEKSAFVIRNGKSVTVSMTSNSNETAAAEAEFDKLLDSFQGK